MVQNRSRPASDDSCSFIFFAAGMTPSSEILRFEGAVLSSQKNRNINKNQTTQNTSVSDRLSSAKTG